MQNERRQVRHILIETGKDDAAALKKAQGVLAEAKSGKDFAELAKKYSRTSALPRTAAIWAGAKRATSSSTRLSTRPSSA
ncbi:MAG: peptidylprolyl isomerase [Gammaproteobacteria bacterium]